MKKDTNRATTQLFSFIELVLRLKSVSDHTYAMCAIGMILSDMLGFDTERVMKMVIIHDLPESITGDHMPGEITRKKKRIEEKRVMTSILRQVPSTIRSNYRKLWEEYQTNKTQIARFVHKLDKLEMAVQANQYINEGYPNKSLITFLSSARRSLNMFKDDHHNYGHRDIILEILDSLEKNIVK
jgi:putative hydrolases of HD superfamily